MSWLYLLLVLLVVQLCLADTNTTVAHPGLDFLDVGGQIGLWGRYTGLSFYNYANASAFLSPSDDSQGLYLRNITSNESRKIATVEGGLVLQLLQLTDDSVLILGDFSSFNGQSYKPPIIYNVSSGAVDAIFSLNLKRDSVLGNVKTTFVDGGLIYMGGDFEYNGTYGAAVYNITSKEISSLPFEGFGQNSSVEAITKYEDGGLGSIIFGGSFDTLGLPELLSHNYTLNLTNLNSTNSTNSSLISAEQVVSLKHATFTSINAALSDSSSMICPAGNTFAFQDNEGGQWLAELPLEMRGVKPTKIRLYVPDDGSDGIRLFRLYTYPNNGIMNLTYVDPSTNQIAYCDAWCPLLLGSTLAQHIEDNKDEREEDVDEYGEVFIQEDGSYAMYYDSSSKSKNLGYGKNYQEFSLIDNVGIDQLGLTVTAWYGSKAVFSGLELYLNSIIVYSNDTLNESNCGGESEINSAVIDGGDWKSVQELVNTVSDTNYLVSVGNNSAAAMTLYPNISYAGDYSILLYTPGCSADGSCDKRAIVKVTVIDINDDVVASSRIYQNNLEDKFDYLFDGHLNGSSTSDGKNRIKIEFDSPIDSSVLDPWMVIDKVVANIVSLDHYYSTNSTNSTKQNNQTESLLLTIPLNGLFEYSLGNFSNFDQNLVYTKSGNKTIIEKTNTFVGNSSINVLSGLLSENTVVQQILLQNSSDSKSLLLLGEFSSQNVSLLNSNVLTLKIDGYNSTSNSTETVLSKRNLLRRDSITFDNVVFNTLISALFDVQGGYVACGQFSASGQNNNNAFKNLQKNNESTTTANNFALNLNGQWYSFGNDYLSADYSQFVEIDIGDTDYYIFSSSEGDYKIWDKTNSKWSDNSNLDISTGVTLEKRDQQILGGSSFGVMDFYGSDAAYFQNHTSFNSYGVNISSGVVLSSFFVNLSFSVIGGDFTANLSIKNVALIKNNVASPLQGSPEWSDEAAATLLYVDNGGQYLFIGTNGSVLTGSSNVTGLAVYNLANQTFASVQPASLSTADDSALKINAMVYYDKSKQFLVGGHFDNAGSLNCKSICIYDVQNTRWVDPLSGGSSQSIEGDVTDARFLSSNQVLLSGNMTINNTDVTFAIYNFASSSLESAGTNLNAVNVDGTLQKYIINEKSSGASTKRMAAYGSGFVIGYNGTQWSSISDGIDFENGTSFTDLKLLLLSKTNTANPKNQYFDSDRALLLSGVFNLSNYGLVNAALFDGSSWIPYIFSSLNSSGLGEIHSVLLEDVYRYQSSSDLERKLGRLSTGKVVGISLACAIGSTAFLGLLYLIPMMFLFKDNKKQHEIDQRIHEDDMMEAVNPGDLLHEIDLQRNS